MTDPERGDEGGAGENVDEQSRIDNKEVNVDINDDDHSPDDSKIGLINGGAGTDVQIQDPTAVSSDGEVSFNGLGKDEVMKYADEPFWKRLRQILFILFWVGWAAMLATAIIIIYLAPRCPPRPDLKWYQTDSVYQVIPKSFKDSSGDGFGDIEGLKSKLEYIDDLGSNTIWLSGIYKVDKNDVGFQGIVNHMELAEDIGVSAETLKAWIKKRAKEGKRVILDLVPNQTSKKHPWFVKSQKKEEKYKDYYVWKSGSTTPNDWKIKNTSKNAWEKDQTRDEWYLHQLGEDYADLDLENPDVVDEIKKIMKFWLDAGVGGFHVCNVEYLIQDYNSNQAANLTQGTKDLLADLRGVVEGYNKPGRERFFFSTLDIQNTDVNQIKSFFGDNKGLHVVMPLMNLDKDSNAKSIKMMAEQKILMEAENNEEPWIGLGLGNQFTSRVASRMGKSADKLNAAHAIQLLMPGTSFTYYGDEFGQYDGDDGTVTTSEHYYSPMQWNNGKNAGFSTSDKIWQAVGKEFKTNNVQGATAHFTSSTPLKVFKDLVKLREEPSFQWGKTKMCPPAEDSSLFIFSRKATRFPFYTTLVNMGSSIEIVSLSTLGCDSKPEGTVVFHSGDSEQVGKTLNFHDHPASIKQGEVVVLEFAADDE